MFDKPNKLPNARPTLRSADHVHFNHNDTKLEAPLHIQREWKIEFNEQDFITFSGGSMAKLLTRPSLREDWEAARAEAYTLIQPAVAWDTFPVREFKHETIFLADGKKISGGPVAAVMAGSTELLVGILTVGGEINRRVSAEQKDGSRMRAMFTDAFGTWALGQVREQFFHQMENEITAQGLHVSTTLAPGESEWPVSQQAVLFSLVDGGSIGIHLNESNMMDPLKSITMLLGMGPGPLGSEGGTNCDFCTIRETCPYRRRTPTPAATE